MLRLDALQVIQLFRRPGGVDFTLFVNDLLRALSWSLGIPESEISTCSRTDAKDGGVDTRIGRGAERDETGYLETRSIWQFKAADEASVSDGDIEREVNKWYAKECIQAGHAYRLCICDTIPDSKKVSKLKAELDAAVYAINPSCPEPKILTVDSLAPLADRFPGLVLRLHPSLSGLFTLFDAWGARETDITPKFIPNSTFEGVSSQVLAHASLLQTVPDAVLGLQGLAGVGKTRTVYECLRQLPQAASLVLYTDDEDNASELATILANDVTAHAILVVDECSLSARQQLLRTLRGCRHRVRCICIDNSAESVVSAAPELSLRKLSPDEVDQVLRANFKEVPADRIRTYAHLAEGFVRLAADMCRFDPQIATAGTISPVMSSIETYYRERLSDDRRRAVEAIALLKRVRHKGEDSNQLDALCSVTHWDRNSLEEQLAAIKEAPGFVERGALYYRVTPELIAIVAFNAAWKRWGEGREDAFLSKIPQSIQEGFLQRVSESANQEVRDTVRTFFRHFADSFSPNDLGNLGMVNRFIDLIETDPDTYLPSLRRIVESATHDQVTRAPRWTGDSWGPRRQLVWMAEKFTQFNEFFPDAEAILFKLATHECEPDIGNNATKMWQQLFRLELSGTPLPLAERLRTLDARLASADEANGAALAGALNSILEGNGFRTLGPPVVAGRIPPTEWRPRDTNELRSAIHAALACLNGARKSAMPAVATGATEALVHAVARLVRDGWVNEIRSVIDAMELGEEERGALSSILKRHVDWWKSPDGTKRPEKYVAMVSQWIGELEPESVHGRLVEEVGSRAWDHYGRETEWQDSLRDLATRLLSDGVLFEQELSWLLSPSANAAFEFGHALGTQDSSAKYLDRLLSERAVDGVGTVRGYVAGLIYGAKVDPAPINQRLDRLEDKHPLFAFHVALAGGDSVHVFDRAVRLITSDKLPAVHLRNFTHWVGNRHVTTDETMVAIILLLLRARSGDALCSDVMIDFLGARHASGALPEILATKPDLVWEALETGAEYPGREAFWWAKVLSYMAPIDPQRAVRLSARTIVSDNFDFRHEAENLLSTFASKYPEWVMDEVGNMMLSESTGWHFFIGKFPLFHSIPAPVVIAWLGKHGVAGAQKIARHIPAPYRSADGSGALHPLTEYVLRTFEDDDRTFAEFSAGVHSLQMYTGDIAGTHENEARNAEFFLNHPLRRVREWARRERDLARYQAQRHREEMDELDE